MHSLLVLLRQAVTVQLLEVFRGQVVDVHVEVSILILVVLRLPVVLCVQDFNTTRSFDFFFELFSVVISCLFDHWVAEVEV